MNEFYEIMVPTTIFNESAEEALIDEIRRMVKVALAKTFGGCTENGKTLASDKILEKRRAAQQQFLNQGVQYIEVEGRLGRLNAMGQHVTEPVYIIEPCVEVNYV